ncbi:MAG: hypothetical protein M1402_03305 [Candidatus Thermoplasmatota archaeon]|nr:hypothetical protein [Candidatus Thermoplasmatota archaeon]
MKSFQRTKNVHGKQYLYEIAEEITRKQKEVLGSLDIRPEHVPRFLES